MDIAILGAGMMGKAIAYDLINFSSFDTLCIIDQKPEAEQGLQQLLPQQFYEFQAMDISKTTALKQIFTSTDVVISALPYFYNYDLTKTAIETQTHFLDLGGNNTVVTKQRALMKKAKDKEVIIIPDCGLAPGLVSIITKDIVEQLDTVGEVHLRVGGIPQHPQPPLNYQLVFSAEGLINEYTEDALVLNNGKIEHRPSLTELEHLSFPEPFGDMEAFLTSGGCSTLPYTYQKTIGYLDYKTIRYPGHCQCINSLVHLGLTDKQPLEMNGQQIQPRQFLTQLLTKNLPASGPDVILLKAWANGQKDKKNIYREYSLIDRADETHHISAMMRTTGYTVSIIAQMIEQQLINSPGVYCCEEIIPCSPFFTMLEQRGIHIKQTQRTD